MLLIKIALVVTMTACAFIVVEWVARRWYERRHRSAHGVGLASEYHMSGDRLRPRLP